jgi:hypothetical protein
MAASVFDLSGNPELRTLLQKEMQYQPLHEPRFGKWMAPNFVKAVAGEVGSVGLNAPRWTGAPIEMQNAFIQEGRSDMLIPIRNRLVGAPVFGDMPLLGKEEAAIFGFRSVRINRTRKAYAPPTGMQKQKTKQWAKNLISNARTDLKIWYSGWTGKSIQMAMYTGFSLDLTFPVSAGGLGLSYVSHPNLWVAGTPGQVGIDATTGTYTAAARPGTAAYEAAVQAAIDGMGVASSANACTAELIQKMVGNAARKKIQQVVLKDGFSFYPIWLKDSAYFQLLRDPEFRELAKRIDNSSLSRTPLGNGALAYYAGAAIYSDLSLFSAYTTAINANVTASTVEYGPRPTTAQLNAGWKLNPNLDEVDNGDYAVGLLVGQSAMTIGTGEELTITEDSEDYDNRQGIGIDVIQSMVRNETYDTSGLTGLTAGDFYENTSSIAFITNSPYTI